MIADSDNQCSTVQVSHEVVVLADSGNIQYAPKKPLPLPFNETERNGPFNETERAI